MGRGRSRSTEKTHPRAGGDQITGRPRSMPATMSAATRSASTAKGAAGRPAVIFVRTKPGLTRCSETPLPSSVSERP